MASQNKIGDKFLGTDGVTTWTIEDRENGRFVVRCVWGVIRRESLHHLSAQKINAMVKSGHLTRVK